MQYYFGINGIGCLDTLQNIFSYMKKKNTDMLVLGRITAVPARWLCYFPVQTISIAYIMLWNK